MVNTFDLVVGAAGMWVFGSLVFVGLLVVASQLRLWLHQRHARRDQ